MLNWIWAAFFLVAFAAALVQAVFLGRPDVFRDVVARAVRLRRRPASRSPSA